MSSLPFNPCSHTSFTIYIALAALTGYYVGSHFNRPEEEEEDDTEGDAENDAFSNSNEECKMVLVVRTDLQMGKGKAAAQCAHAAIACYDSLLKTNPKLLAKWRRYGQAKVTVQCKTEDDMLLLQGIAVSKGITAKAIHDAGRTQIAAGSMTVLGVGPAPKSAIDEVTGHLKLY